MVCLLAFRKIGGIAALILALFSGLFARLIGTKEAMLSMLSIAPSLYFVSISGVLRGYLNGCGRFGKIALSQSAEGVVRFLLCTLFSAFLKSRNLPISLRSAGAVFGITISSAVGYFLLKIEAKSEKTEDKKEQKITPLERKDLLSRLFSVAVPITFSSAVAGVAGLFDLVIFMRRLESIGFSESRAAALFGNYSGIAVPMFNLVASLISPLCLCSLSVFAKEKKKCEGEIPTAALLSFLRSAAYCAAPFAFGFLLFSEPVLSLFFPIENAAVAAPLLSSLSLAVFLMAEVTVINTTLEASGHPLLSLLSMSVFSAVKLLSSFLFIGMPSVAVFGAPIGTTLAYAAGFAVSLFSLKRLNAHVPVFAVSALPLVLSGVSVVMARLLYEAPNMPDSSAFSTLSSVIFAAVCYAVLLFVSGRFADPFEVFGKNIRNARLKNRKTQSNYGQFHEKSEKT